MSTLQVLSERGKRPGEAGSQTLRHPHPSGDDVTCLPYRYSVNEVGDLGGPRKYVIPTPAEMTVTDTNHLQLNTRDWAIYAPDKFSNEARLLGGRM